jgi:hypothetical protein
MKIRDACGRENLQNSGIRQEIIAKVELSPLFEDFRHFEVHYIEKEGEEKCYVKIASACSPNLQCHYTKSDVDERLIMKAALGLASGHLQRLGDDLKLTH